MIELDHIYNMDCLDGIKKLGNIKIDLILTDPPYEYDNKGRGIYSIARFQKQMNKIGEIKTNTFDFYRYIPKFLELQEKTNAYFFCNKKLVFNYLKAAVERELIYDIHVFRKLNPIPAFCNSFMNDLEYIVYLKSSGAYFSSKEGYPNYTKHHAENIGNHGLMHVNQKPLKLLRKYILVSTKPGDIVLDPFMGIGSTAVACKQLGRHFIGFEIVKEFVELAENRLKNIPKRLDLFNYENKPNRY